jgi:N-acetylmuramoyl-L-alanine amidase
MRLQNKFSNATICLWLIMATQVVAAETPPITLREGWGAKPPSMTMVKQIPSAILIHHTGSNQKLKTTLAAKMRGLQRFSQAREKLSDGRTKPAWPDVPYHFYISVDGQIAEGRNINAVGDTNTGYNPAGFIQVVVEGNFESEKVTEAQTASLQALLRSLMKKYKIEASAIQAHKDKAQTACPGKDLAEKLPGIIAGLGLK